MLYSSETTASLIKIHESHLKEVAYKSVLNFKYAIPVTINYNECFYANGTLPVRVLDLYFEAIIDNPKRAYERLSKLGKTKAKSLIKDLLYQIESNALTIDIPVITLNLVKRGGIKHDIYINESDKRLGYLIIESAGYASYYADEMTFNDDTLMILYAISVIRGKIYQGKVVSPVHDFDDQQVIVKFTFNP